MIEIKCDDCETNFSHQNYHFCKICFDKKIVEIKHIKGRNKRILLLFETLRSDRLKADMPDRSRFLGAVGRAIQIALEPQETWNEKTFDMLRDLEK